MSSSIRNPFKNGARRNKKKNVCLVLDWVTYFLWCWDNIQNSKTQFLFDKYWWYRINVSNKIILFFSLTNLRIGYRADFDQDLTMYRGNQCLIVSEGALGCPDTGTASLVCLRRRRSLWGSHFWKKIIIFWKNLQNMYSLMVLAKYY